MTQSPEKPHSRITRLFHLTIALLVVSQVATSEFMTRPGRGREEDLLFEVHEYSGILAFFVIFAFWFTTLLRKRGTPPGLLWPWLSTTRRRALRADTARHFSTLKKFRLPEHQLYAPLPCAIHGLGILLIALMATTGFGWFIADKIGDMATFWGEASKEIHEIFSSLVWVYLIGHTGFAVVNHFAGKQALTDMWSLKPDHSDANKPS